jgi:predicted component of type VI protein secretion system
MTMDSPVLIYLDAAGCRHAFPLSGRGVVTLGRRIEADVCLPWDPGISRLHAELINRAGEWVIADDGLSQNGTYVNGLPVEGRRRLHGGDRITVGSTSITFCERADDDADEPGASADVTMALPEMQPSWTYSEQQQQILAELCRPLCHDGEGVQPASDAAIGEALGLDPGVVARELDAVAHSFGYRELTPEERRLRTALAALRSGLTGGGET